MMKNFQLEDDCDLQDGDLVVVFRFTKEKGLIFVAGSQNVVQEDKK